MHCMSQINRQKLIEAVVYFLNHTKHPGAIKLFKLLYFLDMLHFRETGRIVTGLEYTALPYGPVPLSLFNEFSKPEPDLSEAVSIKKAPKEDPTAKPFTIITPKTSERAYYLTSREQRIAAELALMFDTASADEMSLISHAKGGPWDKAKDKTPGKWVSLIDFFDATSPTLVMGSGKLRPKKELQDRAAELEEVRSIFR